MSDGHDTTIYIAAEDRFLIFPLGRYLHQTCPTSMILGDFRDMLKDALGPQDSITPIFDFRGICAYPTDIREFTQLFSLGGMAPHVLVSEGQVSSGAAGYLGGHGLITIRTKGEPTSGHAFEMSEYVGDISYSDVARGVLSKGAYMALDDPRGWGYRFMCAELAGVIHSIHRQSLLVEFTMSLVRDRITLSPYHSHAIHEIETRHETVLVGRPAIIAQKTGAVFSPEIAEFERLINDPDTKERHLQVFLEQHPNFLKGLNYENIYPQLVLERDDDGGLKPDFILEPFADGFCDILDIKLPSQKVVVGGKNRKHLAAGLHEVAAQLREYATYFEQDKYRKFVHQKYGLRLYWPRLIAIVGRDMKQMKDEQIRRAMTDYVDLQFMTFDELVRHARRRLLI